MDLFVHFYFVNRANLVCDLIAGISHRQGHHFFKQAHSNIFEFMWIL